MSQFRISSATLRIQPLEVAIIVLTGATAFLHVSVALSSKAPLHFPLPGLFYLNAVGYLFLIWLLYLPALHPIQRYIRWLLILYVATTIFAWVALGDRDRDGFLDKGIEGALLILLLVEEWRAAQQGTKTPYSTE